MTLYGSSPGSRYEPPPSTGSPPPEPSRKSTGSTLTKVSFGLFLLVILAAIIQGATVQQVGFGPLTVSFGHKNDNSASGANGSNTAPIGQPPANTGGSSDSGANNQPGAGDQTITVNRSATRGDLTVTVSQVDIQDRHVRLHIKAHNEGGQTVELYVFGNFTATDNTGKSYTPSMPDSTSLFTVPSGGDFSGTVELQELVDPNATSLTASFAQAMGFGAPTGSITIRDIPLH